MSFKATLMIVAALFSSCAFADNWLNRDQVVRTAEQLQEQVEIFDEALHEGNFPEELIKLVHHFEETTAEFAALAKTGTRSKAAEELEHLNEDIQVIQRRLARSDVPRVADVRTKWFSLRDAALRLNRQFRWFN